MSVVEDLLRRLVLATGQAQLPFMIAGSFASAREVHQLRAHEIEALTVFVASLAD